MILGNKNAVKYKDVFPLIKSNKLWTGRTEWAGGMWFETKDDSDVDKIIDGVMMKNVASIWLTNFEHGRRHQLLQLMSEAGEGLGDGVGSSFLQEERHNATVADIIKRIVFFMIRLFILVLYMLVELWV